MAVLRRRAPIAALSALLAALLWLPSSAPAEFDGSGAAATLLAAAPAPPPGFQETVALSGLTNPTAVRFAPDGTIFVAEKGGLIKRFDDFGDPTPTVYADLSRQVADFWDRGLLGLALDPQFTTGRPYVYVLYAYDKDPNSAQFPRWNDACPTPPGATDDGCMVSGRLSRLNGGVEQVLIQDWCQQYPSHSIGSLAFGADGALYVSAGDGASFNFADFGQDGAPRNPCGDPPAVVGGAQTPPTAEGGALRSQDIRTLADPTGLDGTILRLDPDTGAAAEGNPNAGSANVRRIVAYGLRNPFRMTVRPGTNELWTGDVGWMTWEEINRIPNPTAAMRNYGWPCYEGTGRMVHYDALDLNLCESLYGQGTGAHTGPYYTYNHSARVVPGESCPVGASSISGLAFTPQESSFPPAYDGALFFSDYSRDCIWVMLRGADGLPDPARLESFVPGASNPAELQFGPGGDLYYVDLEGGAIRRIRSLETNHAPIARATATPSSGGVPLTVAFDGSASSDPDGLTITYAWDLDGDGAFDDSTAVRPSFTYTTAGTYTARLRVTDPGGLSDTFNLPITAGTPPVPVITITSPPAGATWKVDDTIAFSGSATEWDGDPIPASGLTWDINLQHCDRVSGSCHTHPLQTFSGVDDGSFPAPDHGFPSYLEIELTAQDANGLTATASRRLDPRTVRLTLDSRPAGLRIAFAGEVVTTPFSHNVIQGSTNSIGAETPQTLGGLPYTFSSWSNAGARNHTTLVDADTTLTATFEPYTARRMGGTDVVDPGAKSIAEPGMAEVYRTVAEEPGTATELHLYVHEDSTASALVLGLYADAGGAPGTLLGSGRIENPAPGAWNAVGVDIPGIEAGRAYWFGILHPEGGTGELRWHDHAGPIRMPEQQSASRDLAQLPTSWEPGLLWDGGPVSGYIVGTPPPSDPPAPPVPIVPQDSPPSRSEPPAAPSPPARGPVGAWGFDEPSGRTAIDASGAGNSGRLGGPVRTRGRFGGGLAFDGAGDWVTVPDSDSLDLTTAMTLEAWVRPAARGSAWRSVIVKERGSRLAYALYAKPSGHVFTARERALRTRTRLRRNRWSHLATTWDGLTLRLYVNGRQVSSSALSGVARTSAGPLRIGGNGIWPEWFRGVIDEVRVYDRALSADEIARDRDTRINPGTSPRKARSTGPARPRRTSRSVHRGTRWLSGSGAAARSG